jgi:hypothetical protein
MSRRKASLLALSLTIACLAPAGCADDGGDDDQGDGGTGTSTNGGSDGDDGSGTGTGDDGGTGTDGATGTETEGDTTSDTGSGTDVDPCEAMDRRVLECLFLSGSWHTPAADIPADPSRQFLLDLLYTDGTANQPGNFNLGFKQYTYPVYIADENTPEYLVESQNPDWGTLHGETMPLDPAWDPSVGTDGQIIVVDPTTERYYDLWQYVGITDDTIHVSNGSVIPDFLGASGINPPSRACGIAYFAMLVTPEEVEAGLTDHALSMSGVRNTSPDYVAPAVKSDGFTDGGVPVGTRYALTMTDDDIDTWVESKPAELRPLARALGTALRDYGWIVTDTGGGAFIQIEDVHSASEAWIALGLDLADNDDSIRNLLDDLDWQGAVVLEPR